MHHRQLHVRDRAGAADVVLLTRAGAEPLSQALIVVTEFFCRDFSSERADFSDDARLDFIYIFVLVLSSVKN